MAHHPFEFAKALLKFGDLERPDKAFEQPAEFDRLGRCDLS
jgi:hypothetical protein